MDYCNSHKEKEKKNLLPVLHLSTSLTLTFFSFFYYYLIPLCTTFLHFICKPEEYKTFIGHKTSFSSSLSDGMKERKKKGRGKTTKVPSISSIPPALLLPSQYKYRTLHYNNQISYVRTAIKAMISYKPAQSNPIRKWGGGIGRYTR